MRHEFDVNNNDHGPSHFMRGQALSLRALCRYEEPDSSTGKINRKSQTLDNAEKDLKEARFQGNHIGCRKYDLLSTERMLLEELINSKGCKDWEHGYTFSLLSVPTKNRKTERDSATYAIVNPFYAYYVISPDKSLRQDQCQEKLLWKHVGDVIVERLKARSFFMYAGHGNGLNYIPGGGAARRTHD
nr:hypothetical protein [Tanacetum cinerariifolium]